MSRNTYYHGVVTPNRIAVDSHEGPRVIVAQTFPRVTALLHLAEFYHLHTIWVAPGNELSHCDPVAFQDADQDVWDLNYQEVPAHGLVFARMKQVTAWRQHGTFEDKRTIKINFIEQGQWGWKEEDPLTLLLAIVKLNTKLLPMDAHPGGVGRELMKFLVQRDLQLCPRVDLDKLGGVDCGRDFSWKRPILQNEVPQSDDMIACRWLHAYDKNAQRLSGAEGATLGIGDPTFYYGDNIKRPDVTKAGIWRITASPRDPSKGMERPLTRFSQKLPWPLEEDQEWCTAPVLKCLLEMGADVKVFQGYEWPLSRRALRTWATGLWAGRQEFAGDTTPVGRICYDAMKRIYTAAMGLLGSEKSRDRTWYRPDWLSTIIETAKARMIYNIDHYGKEFHIWPCMVHVDALYYVSDSPEPDKRLLEREKELGGYKHQGSWQIDEELLGWFADPDKSSGDVLHLLHLREKEYAR